MGFIDAIIRALWNPSPAWREDDIARTNFIAAAIRDLITARTEVYVKWWYGGAFNGAAWLLDQNESADVSFYRRLPRHSTSGTVVDFSRGKAIAHVPARHRGGLAETVALAESQFEKSWQAEGAALLASVSRVQFWLWITSDRSEAAERCASDFMAAVGKLLGGNVSSSGISAMPLQNWQVDLDVCLPAPEAHNHVIEMLQAVLPGLSGSMFGQGATISELQPQTDSSAWINGGLVTARQK